MNPLTPARVMLDDLGPFDCLTYGDTCPNGYSLPVLTLDQVHRIAAVLDAEHAFRPEADVLRIEGEVVEVRDEEGELVERCPPGADGLYRVGHGCWTWRIVDPAPAVPVAVPAGEAGARVAAAEFARALAELVGGFPTDEEGKVGAVLTLLHPDGTPAGTVVLQPGHLPWLTGLVRESLTAERLAHTDEQGDEPWDSLPG
ncbi:hypothetical protein OG618_37855 (plasmid) [Kitasatospora sp. NBC_01246]|uniref:hypothetical protein n=1 Tax=Kitasatospora sp. NBC_01246 TaxID=2903570 RepID=UPI002E360997|nr:hypothetical protein [Kitasatospora sp. NBC_01246]